MFLHFSLRKMICHGWMPSIRSGSRDQEMSSLKLKGIRQYPTLIASNATRAQTHRNNLHQIQMIVVIPDAKKVTTVLYRFALQIPR